MEGSVTLKKALQRKKEMGENACLENAGILLYIGSEML